MTNGTIHKTHTSWRFDTPSLAYKMYTVYWQNKNGYHEKNNKGHPKNPDRKTRFFADDML